ncbi:DegT/DnrJ/EryC1/StrS family aminotransferase [Streptomyces canus]|uniref:DegT/DnrJ/EryC1/StrS family aminotransferase n=1 Tax=Streptomyces canus TaxID=58343 RepID=UPI0030E16898
MAATTTRTRPTGSMAWARGRDHGVDTRRGKSSCTAGLPSLPHSPCVQNTGRLPGQAMSDLSVPFAHVDAENGQLLATFAGPLAQGLASGRFIGGDDVAEFEARFARMHGTAHAVAVGSGTDALKLTIRALGLAHRGTGITVANTFLATVGAMVTEGVRPLLVDVRGDENIDVTAVEKAITPSTTMVVAVHLRGLPADVHALRDLCAARSLTLIEDCAQAVLATVGGVPVGTFGEAGCFSLHPLKNLGACGDAGIVVTDNPELAAEIRLLRNHGLRDRDTSLRWGENSRLDALQARLLNLKLDYIEEWTRRRRNLARLYDEELAGLPLTTPAGDDGHVYHRYVIRVAHRDALRTHLRTAGIETAVHYPVPVHRQPAANDGSVDVADGGLPVTEQQAREILSLPLHPLLREDQIRYVARRIEDFLGR